MVLHIIMYNEIELNNKFIVINELHSKSKWHQPTLISTLGAADLISSEA